MNAYLCTKKIVQYVQKQALKRTFLACAMFIGYMYSVSSTNCCLIATRNAIHGSQMINSVASLQFLWLFTVTTVGKLGAAFACWVDKKLIYGIGE